jgi:hypothetical protein
MSVPAVCRDAFFMDPILVQIVKCVVVLFCYWWFYLNGAGWFWGKVALGFINRRILFEVQSRFVTDFFLIVN